MGDMSQHSIRFPAELADKIRAIAEAEDRTFSYVVVRAMERAFGDAPRATESRERPAPPRPPEAEPPHAREMKRQLDAPVPHGPTTPRSSARTPSPLAARQAALNKSKGM